MIFIDCERETSGFIRREKQRKFFAFQPADIVRKTYERTTQHYRKLESGSTLHKHYKSPFPAHNVHRRSEDVGTDTVFSDVPAVDGGETCAQIFVGRDSLVVDVYGMKTEKQFVNTLQDNVRARGAPTRLLSDSAKVETSARVKDYLRYLIIGVWNSEPHQQQQNFPERQYQRVKGLVNLLLDRCGSLAYTWLLCMMYVCFILNRTATKSINYMVPLTVLTGSTVDISPLLRFTWWEKVYYMKDDSSFPSESVELPGRFVGIAENVGHYMTFKVLDDESKRVIYRSNV